LSVRCNSITDKQASGCDLVGDFLALDSVRAIVYGGMRDRIKAR
jgi:hypothetical protein